MQRLGYWIDLGTMDYQEAWQLQLRLVEQRQRQEIPDVLLLCQHPHVVTVGRRQTAQANILSRRFPVYEVERGGDVTYHGPGQLVGYPILFLEPHEQDPHQFLRRLEEAICRICGDFGVPASTKEKYTGVWTQDCERKLASLGVALRNGVTFHGFALNVTTDLSCFSEINPCGLSSQVMTSLEKERKGAMGSLLTVEAIYSQVAVRVGEAFQREFIPRRIYESQELLGLGR